MTKDLFKKALKLMIEDGEFTKIINSCKNIGERNRARKDYDMIMCGYKSCDLEEIPIIVYLNGLTSAAVYSSIVSYMIEIESRLARGETNGQEN